MTTAIDTVKTAVYNKVEANITALGTVGLFYNHMAMPGKLGDNLAIAFWGSGPDRAVTGGKRHYYEFVFTYGRIYSPKDESMAAAEAELNAIEDVLRDTLDGSSDAAWLKASWQRSTRPDSPRGVSNIRFGATIIRFRLR